MSQRLVVDASAGVELLLNTVVGQRLRSRLPAGAEQWVPELYFAEVAAALRRLELARTISSERASVALNRLMSSPAHVTETKPLIPPAWHLRHNVTVADAIYVVLCQELGASLVTTDHRLTRSPGLDVETISS